MELTIPLPWMHLSPASKTSHLELSIMMGTRAISGSAAIRFKNSMQENSKKHVLFEDVIEASHNGIVSWEKSSNIQPILMQGKDDHFKTRERWKIFKEFFN